MFDWWTTALMWEFLCWIKSELKDRKIARSVLFLLARSLWIAYVCIYDLSLSFLIEQIEESFVDLALWSLKYMKLYFSTPWRKANTELFILFYHNNLWMWMKAMFTYPAVLIACHYISFEPVFIMDTNQFSDSFLHATDRRQFQGALSTLRTSSIRLRIIALFGSKEASKFWK